LQKAPTSERFLVARRLSSAEVALAISSWTKRAAKSTSGVVLGTELMMALMLALAAALTLGA